MLGRILSNTRKQIWRSGWTAWASVSVMTLAFLVAVIFGGLAYFANLNIQSIEAKNNMIVFFNPGVDVAIINKLWDSWKLVPQIKAIHYLSEEDAYKLYSDYTARVNPEMYEALKSFREPKLNSSLEIQLKSLDDFEKVKKILQQNIESELAVLEIVPADAPQSYTTSAPKKYKFSDVEGRAPIVLKSDDSRLEQQREIFNALRIAGMVIITLLFIVIVFFTFMTVEFRLYNQMEEIGVMQLVGGSLLFIRAPYVLEGGFYGFFGALIATLMIGSVLIGTFVLDKTSAISRFVYENFSQLPWPHISSLGWIIVFFGLAIVGFVIGSVSSFISIRRYIR